jgi:hypothetical protein
MVRRKQFKNMVGLKSDEKYTEKKIQSLLESRFDTGNVRYTVSNLYLFRHDWETDFLVVQRNSEYCYEIEIKISRSDFFNDFKKVDKHSILKDGTYMKRKYRYPTDPVTGKRIHEKYYEPEKWDYRPNKFYYCVPEGMIKEEEVPLYAGLMYVTPMGIITVKEAKFIHKEKLKLKDKLCDKFYFYWKDSEKTIQLLEKERKKYEDKIKLLQEKQETKEG